LIVNIAEKEGTMPPDIIAIIETTTIISTRVKPFEYLGSFILIYFNIKLTFNVREDLN